jgi:hypothetical protein
MTNAKYKMERENIANAKTKSATNQNYTILGGNGWNEIYSKIKMV